MPLIEIPLVDYDDGVVLNLCASPNITEIAEARRLEQLAKKGDKEAEEEFKANYIDLWATRYELLGGLTDYDLELIFKEEKNELG